MASPPPQSPLRPPPAAAEREVPDEEQEADLPLTMAASIMLTTLPRDARKALQAVGLDEGKVTIRLQPVGSAPHLRQRVFKISASQRFETVVKFLRKKLNLKEHEHVFCYVNSVFAPGLDEGVGNLWRCFKVKDELVVAYAVTPAFG